MTTGLAAKAQRDVQVLEIVKEIEIAASMDIVYESLLEQIGPSSETPDGESIPMTLELWPGGRWYGATWCWGHVQVIEPQARLEIWGTHFMQYPAVAHFQYLLSESNGLTVLKFHYRVIGMIEEADRTNVGRCEFMQRVRKMAEIRSGAK